jgi:hypothetical protein
MTSMIANRRARAAAVTTWIYAAGFGVPAVPVAVYLMTEGRLPTFLGLFDMYGGPWSSRLKPEQFVALLTAFLVPTGMAAWSAWGVWRGRKAGAVVNLAVLPFEAIFWLGFALPIPWLAGVARVTLLAAGWRALDGSRPRRLRQPIETTGAEEDVAGRV